MFIHYISCHSVLEYDEVKLFTELGYDVFSNGAYADPKGHFTLPRPAIEGAKFHEDLLNISREHPKTALPPELIEPFDVIMLMHSPDVLIQNWDMIKHKRVIFRSIGQSTPALEAKLRPLVEQGLEIVRYSPKEANLANYAGASKIIRFYKDENEYQGWNGENKDVVNFTQSLLGRRYFCHYDEITSAMAGFNSKIYGVGNEDLGVLNGGEVSYEKQKEIMRRCGVYVYGGTWPACYTLSIMEAMMTGCPVVAIGDRLARTDKFEQLDFYEIPDIIEQGISGFYADSVEEMRGHITNLLGNTKLALEISKEARKRAIKMFGREEIAKQWKEYLG